MYYVYIIRSTNLPVQRSIFSTSDGAHVFTSHGDEGWSLNP